MITILLHLITASVILGKLISGCFKTCLRGSHKNNYVKDTITNSGNKYLFSIPYTPHTNGAIEAYFNQIKHYLKLNKKVLKFNELKEETKKTINKVSKEKKYNIFI